MPYPGFSLSFERDWSDWCFFLAVITGSERKACLLSYLINSVERSGPRTSSLDRDS